MRYYDGQDPYQKPSSLGRFGSWLGRRPFESWGFFLAGFIVARILFLILLFIGTLKKNKKTKSPRRLDERF